MSKDSRKEFVVLGSKVVINKDDSGIDPQSVVDKVLKEAAALKRVKPDLNNQSVATLVALKIASENLALEKEYKTNIEKLETSVSDALSFIDELLVTSEEGASVEPLKPKSSGE